MRQQTVLITGAAGFVGRHVAKEFSNNGDRVIGIGRGSFPEYKEWGLSTWCQAELSIAALQEHFVKPDVIIHCAGGASVGASVEAPRDDFCNTVDSTSQLLEFIRLNSPDSQLIYLSSAAVYGQVKEVPISESVIFNPVSPYGMHKLMSESLCQLYASRYNLSVIIVRLFSVYGEGLRKQLLWDACNKLSHEDTSFFGSGAEVRDWLHINDAAVLIRMALEHTSSKCLAVNAGSGKGLKVRDVLQAISDEMGVEKELVFSAVAKDGDPDVLLGDVSKVLSWGWRPKVIWQDAIRSYVKWFQACG